MLKFFYSPGACSLAAHIVLQESGEPRIRWMTRCFFAFEKALGNPP